MVCLPDPGLFEEVLMARKRLPAQSLQTNTVTLRLTADRVQLKNSVS